MAESVVEIANVALMHLGEPTISSLTEGTDAADVVNARWATTRDEVLRDHHWNFAIKRSVLTKLVAAPAFGYDNQYQLPTDYLYALSIDENFHLKDIQYGDRFQYSIEGDRLLTDRDEVDLTYVRKETDPTKYDPLFVEAVAAKLAMNISFRITGSSSLTDVTRTLYKDALKKARAKDARENARERRSVDFLSVRDDG